MLPILVAVGVGVGLAVVTAVVAYRVSARINTVQRQINKVENRLSAAGAFWLSELFADFVIGDVKAAEIKIRQFVEANDTTLFFLDNVAFPLTLWTIRETRVSYPDKYKAILKEVAAEQVSAAAATGQASPSAQ